MVDRGTRINIARRKDFSLHLQCTLKMMLHGTICATDTKTTLMFEVVSDLRWRLTLPVTETQSKHHMLFVSV